VTGEGRGTLNAHQRAAKLRRARARREQLGPQHGPGPGLPLSARCSTTNVTWLDLAPFMPRELIEQHKRELLRRRIPGELTPTDVMRLALLGLFRGLKHGGLGAAMQVPVYGECKMLGAGESTVQASNARLLEAKLIERFDCREEILWTDAAGVEHVEASIWPKTYITARGLERLRSLGSSTRRIVSTGPQRARVLTVVGLAGWLLKACSSLLRMLARRFAGAFENETPPLRGTTLTEENQLEGARAGRAPVSSTLATGPPSRTSRASPLTIGARGLAGWRAFELERLYLFRALTAAQAWPDLYWTGDRAMRRWLDDEFRAHYERELRERFERVAMPADRAIQQRRVDDDNRKRAKLEAAEPPLKVQRFRYHQYGELWRGGRWVTAPVTSINELKKVQTAMRDAGELAPKRRRPA
jgi:hypothetical protein